MTRIIISRKLAMKNKQAISNRKLATRVSLKRQKIRPGHKDPGEGQPIESNLRISSSQTILPMDAQQSDNVSTVTTTPETASQSGSDDAKVGNNAADKNPAEQGIKTVVELPKPTTVEEESAEKPLADQPTIVSEPEQSFIPNEPNEVAVVSDDTFNAAVEEALVDKPASTPAPAPAQETHVTPADKAEEASPPAQAQPEEKPAEEATADSGSRRAPNDPREVKRRQMMEQQSSQK
jgi:ribonuclease E